MGSINGGHDEWKSDHKHGHNVEWGHDGHWDHHVHHLDHIIEIKMGDHEGLLNNEPIGHFKDEVKVFCHGEGSHEMAIELKHMGHVAAEVVMHVHFDRDCCNTSCVSNLVCERRYFSSKRVYQCFILN